MDLPEIKKLLDAIPRDIRIKIYREHFSCGSKFKIINQILISDESKRLNATELISYFEQANILLDTKLITYMRIKDPLFDQIYDKHYIQNDKNFILMPMLDSLCVSWLFHLYH